MRLLTNIVIWAFVLYGCAVADAQHIQAKECAENRFDQEYEQVLDAYFAHVRGNSPSAIVLRVYGGLLPEYEILLDPETSPGVVVRYAPARSIWGNVYDIGKSHLTMEQYVTQAEALPFTKSKFDVSDQLMQRLLSKAREIDTSICEHQPMKGTRGESVIVKDALSFEIIEEQGRARARVTDAGPRVVSQNPALLGWGHNLLQAVSQPTNRK